MRKIIACFFILFPFILLSQEVTINTFLTSDQRNPLIVSDGKDSYVVVWTSFNQVSDSSREDIFMQSLDVNLNKTGAETQVNNITEYEQKHPSAAMNQQGDLVITWSSFINSENIYDIKARLYKNNVAVSDEFPVNTPTAYTQTKPSVDIFSDGSFVIVWESWQEDGSDRGIFGQRYNSNGTRNGEQFQVNLTTQFSQARPIVKYFPDGKFIVVWESWKQDIPSEPGYGVFGRIFNAAGEPIDNEIQINQYTKDYQWYADVYPIDEDNFIAVWCSWEQDGFDGGIYLNQFNTEGEPVGNEILVNSTSKYYQWLPKFALTPGGNIAVVWSSWLQDGSREGVYAKILDQWLNEKSFETGINDKTDSFQWEPAVAVINDNEFLIVWSDYDTAAKNYNIKGKKSSIPTKAGFIDKSGFEHISGISTAEFLVSVVDSTQVTGDTYELSFAENTGELYAVVKNKNDNSVVLSDFYLNKGEDVYYLTPVFDGIALEIKPVLELKVDFNTSFFLNNSGTNLAFNLVNPSGTTVIAPMDAFIEWGDASKNPDGTFVNPLDSAYSSSGRTEIKTPFRAWDITNNKKLDCYVVEPPATKNKMWDPGESIIILTPPEYQVTFPNFHVQYNSTLPVSEVIWPAPGDTTFIYTRRPLTTTDVYTFSTSSQYIKTNVEDEGFYPGEFSLKQNYPNPFNPSTTISFSIPEDGMVRLKVFNVLGELVATLKNEYMQRGNYRFIFNNNSESLASGVYLYSLEAGNRFITRKMVLLK
jgi:hypothetical protein